MISDSMVTAGVKVLSSRIVGPPPGVAPIDVRVTEAVGSR